MNRCDAVVDLDKPLIDQLEFRRTVFSTTPPGEEITPDVIRQKKMEIQNSWDEPTERFRRIDSREEPELEIQMIEFPSLAGGPPSDRDFPASGNHGPVIDKRRITKLNEKAVLEIFQSTRKYKVLAAKFGVSVTTIHGIKKRRIWRHVTEGLGDG